MLLLLLPGKGPGSYLNVIGPAGLVMMGKSSRVPKLLVNNRLKLYTIWSSCRMALIRLGQSTSYTRLELFQGGGDGCNVSWQVVPFPTSTREERIKVDLVVNSLLEKSSSTSCSTVSLL